MNTLRSALERACRELGLTIEVDTTVSLPSGRKVVTLARIPELGGESGMLVVASFDDIEDVADELVSQGYGYSVLSEPLSDEAFDLAAYREMFSDWGWREI